MVEGVIAGKGLDDELTGQMFVAVQTTGGRSYYVRLAAEVAESLNSGDAVKVGVEAVPWLRPADRIVAGTAQENAGIYDPEHHRRALEKLNQQGRAADPVSAQDRVTANVRRLERLVRFGLAKRLPDGRWRIPPDLVSQLQDRERTHPQTRIRVERSAPERAPVIPRGVSERATVAQSVAKELRMTYVSDPVTFKGRLLECTVARSGQEFARVVDHARGEFTLIPKPPEWDRLYGRAIQLSRDREQKLVIQRSPGISR